MWDKLDIRIPFKKESCNRLANTKTGDEVYYYDVRRLPVDMPLNAGVNRFSEVEYSLVENKDVRFTREALDYRHPFQSIPSSFSGLAVKVSHLTTVLKDEAVLYPHIQLKASPVKLLQGHNASGFVSLARAFDNYICLLMSFYPELIDDLDIFSSEIVQLDATFSVYLRAEKDKELFFKMLRGAGQGQTKLKNDYGSTLYFNGFQTGGVRESVVYDKFAEIDRDIKKDKNPITRAIKQKLIDDHGASVRRAVRFEGRINNRGLKRLGLPTKLIDFIKLEAMINKSHLMPLNPEHISVDQDRILCYSIWNYCFKDVLKSLRGQKVNVMSDERVELILLNAFGYVNKKGKLVTTKAKRLYYFYLSLRAVGFEPARCSADRTYRRNITELQACGISKAVIKSIKSGEPVNVVIFPTLVMLDFRASKGLPDHPIADLPAVALMTATA